jgi:hypothetical protein
MNPHKVFMHFFFLLFKKLFSFAAEGQVVRTYKTWMSHARLLQTAKHAEYVFQGKLLQRSYWVQNGFEPNSITIHDVVNQATNLFFADDRINITSKIRVRNFGVFRVHRRFSEQGYTCNFAT